MNLSNSKISVKEVKELELELDSELDLGLESEVELRYLQEISKIYSKINEGIFPHEVLNHVFDSFESIIPYDRIGFAELDLTNNSACLKWHRSKLKAKPILKSGYCVNLKGSSLETIKNSSQPRIINDLESYLREHPHSYSTKLILKEGMLSNLTCPLIVRNKPIGFLFFSSTQKNSYRNTHTLLFQHIASVLSSVLDKSYLYENLVNASLAKEEILGVIAHDLKNPLSVIHGYIKLILGQSYANLPTDMKEDIFNRIDNSCVEMMSVISDLQDASSIESGSITLNKETIDLKDYLWEKYKEFTVLARNKSICLELDLEKDLPQISFDKIKMDRVIHNLISNAIKYSPLEQKVIIRAKVDSVENSKNNVLISVTDNGPGVPAKDFKRIFKKFGRSQTVPTGGEKSSGLGLYIAKEIVEAHKGTIKVESEQGKGSTFTIILQSACQDYYNHH